MEATFKGRLGQTVNISGTPEEIATAYAYLAAADIGAIRAMDQANKQTPPQKQTPGRYSVEEIRDSKFEGRNVGDLFDAMLDFMIDRDKRNGENGDGNK